MKNIKVILAHPGKQHSFRVAAALKEKGVLYKYITTVYDKRDSWMMKLVQLFLGKENKQRALNRKCDILQDSDVVLFSTSLSFILLLAVRLDKKKYFARWLNDVISRHFQKKVAYYAIKHHVDVVIGYDANCAVCFDILRKKAPYIKRVMDNAAPNRHYLYKIYNEHWNDCGPFKETFEAYKYLYVEKEALRFTDEIKSAEYHIVASSFSKEALVYDGVIEDSIFVVPYGIDSDRFIDFKRDYKLGYLNLLFIGEVNQRKGIYQICEAAKRINNPNIHFNIVGSGYDAMKHLYAPYEKYVKFHGTAYFEKMKQHLKENHVFLFPSMGDGFGLVLLEAMAAGLPVIASKNSAGPDVVKNGKNGFLIDACDVEVLMEKILWFYNNMDQIALMGKASQLIAKNYTWESYNRQIICAISKIIANE